MPPPLLQNQIWAQSTSWIATPAKRILGVVNLHTRVPWNNDLFLALTHHPKSFSPQKTCMGNPICLASQVQSWWKHSSLSTSSSHGGGRLLRPSPFKRRLLYTRLRQRASGDFSPIVACLLCHLSDTFLY